VNAFTRALAPLFIGRRRDFYIPKIPSKLRNIPSVNMYMNVFYISYIFRLTISGLRRFKIPDLREFATSRLRRFKIPDLRESATSSHTKPGLFEAASLTWLPTDS
jgi:hypothetical protein